MAVFILDKQSQSTSHSHTDSGKGFPADQAAKEPCQRNREDDGKHQVLVVDQHGQPLMPCHPARARRLLHRGRAAVYQQQPFTIMLLKRVDDTKAPTGEERASVGPTTDTRLAEGVPLERTVLRATRCSPPNHNAFNKALKLFYLTGFLITVSGSATAKQEALLTDPHCQLFSRLQTESEAGIRQQLVRSLAVDLKEKDPLTLRARAEVARRGLYGFKVDLRQALKLYLFSAEKGSPVSAYNASLLLYQQIKSRPNAMVASKIIDILALAKIDEDEPKNEAAVRGYFILGEIYRHGWTTGQQDLKKAFFYYQKSARKNFFPAVYPYLSLMAGSMKQFDENERLPYQNEMRKLLDRWKWVSIEVMELAGDVYSAGILPDDGVMAQFHWRLAMHMKAGGHSNPSSSYQKRLDPILEKRVERMIRRTLGQRPQLGKEMANRTPTFVDLCAPIAKN